MPRILSFVGLLTFSSGLGCGPSTSPEPPDPLADSAFAGEPAEGYQPPPPPCPPDLTPDDRPTLPLPRHGGVELYLPSADLVDSWGIDYEVWPPHRTDALRIDPEFDPDRDPPEHIVDSLCPTTLAGRSLAVDDAIDEVVRVRVTAASSTDASRSTDVFYPHGSRTLLLHTDAIHASPNLEGDWYLILQPLWGKPRISVTRIAALGGDVAVPHVPVGPVVLHVVRTTAIEPGPADGTLIAPGGFSELWPHLVGQWYAAPSASVAGNDSLTPTVVIGDGTRWRRSGLLLLQPYEPARPNVFVALADLNEPIPVEIPCGATTSFRVLGIGTATLTFGAAVWNANPTAHASVTPTCPSGVDHVEATLTGSSGRSIESFVTLVGGEP